MSHPVHPPPPPPPIARLPDDVLHDIFYLFASGSSVGSTSCIPLSHVCRYWRDIALSSPPLWSIYHLSTHSRVPMLREFLARSGNAPLFVKMKGPCTVWESTEDLVRMAGLLSDHSARFFEFHVVGFLPHDMSMVLAPFTSPAPQLRRLTVHAGLQMAHPAVFMGWMPMLCEVSIMEVLMPWLPYRNLVELDLSDQIAPSLDEILWTLQNSPGMEAFSLMLHKPSDPSSSSHLSSIRLDRLRKLTLGSTHATDDVLGVLEYLSFPATTAIKIMMRGGHRNIVDLGRCSPSIQDIANNITQAFLQFLSVDGMCSVVLTSVDRPIHLEWQWTEAEEDESEVTRVGLAAIQLPELRNLVIHVYQLHLRTEQWVDILGHVPTINTLKLDLRSVHESTFVTFYSALAQHTWHGNFVVPELMHFCLLRIPDLDARIWEHLVLSLIARSLAPAELGVQRLRLLEVAGIKESHSAPLPLILTRRLKGIVEEISLQKWSTRKVRRGG